MIDYLAIIVVVGLAAYRLARVIARDKVGEPVRNWAYRQAGLHGRAGRWVNSLVTCPFCLSVYFSALAVLWWVWLIADDWPGIGEVLLAIPAAAGVAAILSAVDLALTTWAESHE